MPNNLNRSHKDHQVQRQNKGHESIGSGVSRRPTALSGKTKARSAEKNSDSHLHKTQARSILEKTTLSRRKKILMYEAIVTSKLLFALDVTPLTENGRNSFNACFFKGLRQIMGFKTTYGQTFSGDEKSNTNKKLME